MTGVIFILLLVAGTSASPSNQSVSNAWQPNKSEAVTPSDRSLTASDECTIWLPDSCLTTEWDTFVKENRELIESIEFVSARYLGPVLAVVGVHYYEMPRAEAWVGLVGAGFSQLVERLYSTNGDRTSSPLQLAGYDTAPSAEQAFECMNHRVDQFFGFAGRPKAEFLHYDRAKDDLRMQGAAYRKYCGPLTGHFKYDSELGRNLWAMSGDKSKLQNMCATAMSPDNLNLCLGSGGIIANYLDIANRAYARAMHLLDGLSKCEPSGASKYEDPCENDLAFLQLMESSWYWHWGHTRLSILTDYTVLIAACYHEKPTNTGWQSQNGNVGLAALADAKQTLESVVDSVETDLLKLKSKAMDAQLRMYKKSHIEAFQTTVCKTDGKGKREKRSKNYVLLRDTNAGRPQPQPKIDLSAMDKQNAAEQCFGTSKKCNAKAKNNPMYERWQSENWPGDDVRNFAVGCYSLGDKGESKIPEVDLKNHWRPEEAQSQSVPSLERLEGPQGRSIGYSTEKYLDINIRPDFSEKYDQLHKHVEDFLSAIRGENVLAGMQKILDANQGGRRLRGVTDESLTQFVKLELVVEKEREEIYM